VLKRFAVPKQAAQDWAAFVRLIDRLRRVKDWPAEFEPLRTWYEPHLRRLYDDAEIRAADILQLQQIAPGYRSRERFLTDLTLEPPDATSGHARANTIDEEYTTLSTIHSAKGGEWQHVRVLNVVDGCIPSTNATRTSEEIEEERRLLHVAMTRSKDELDLIVPQRLFMYHQNGNDGGHTQASITRFIPKSIHHAFELKHWSEPGAEPRFSKPKWRSKRIDVASRVEEMRR
jgi:DNA helicase II / ATP-dependent DNA helicase PcrA